MGASGEWRTARGPDAETCDLDCTNVAGSEGCRARKGTGGGEARMWQTVRCRDARAGLRTRLGFGPAKGRIRSKGIGQWSKAFAVASRIERVVLGQKIAGLSHTSRESGHVLRKNRPAFMKQNEQVGSAVIVAINDRPNVIVSCRVELFNEIDSIIEVSIGFTSDERAVDVVLLDVCATVEIRVDSYFRGLAVVVVLLPDVGSTVAIAVFGAEVSALRRR
jgi:hypothetical protein